ncbi:MAG TPA: endonuclease/exonuclease/phosphatase family protein [Acidimicrobiales bacterium]|nr:endonuclease/exonuclease/phosphatase family protein [Acidimicrobiales bacterium]
MSSAAPATRRERLILYQLNALGYLACAALLIFAIVRSANIESAALLALYGVTPWLYLPVYAVVGYAFSARKWVLFALGIGVVMVHLVTIWPDIKPPDRLDATEKSAPRLRVFSANLYYSNRDLSGILDEVRASDPDIAVFQEVTSSHRARLLRDPGLAGLPNRVNSPNSDTVLFSRLPIESSEIWYDTYRPLARARLSTDIGSVEIVVVHTIAPINDRAIQGWRQMLDALQELAKQRTMPMLMVGDFNATMYHPRFVDLLETGLTDAHSARGTGFTGTWPRDRALPPFLRIDHALSSKELVPVEASYGDGRGSDHRPIIVDYALVAIASK